MIFRPKSFLLMLLPLLPMLASAQFTDVINSNRPGESMAAFSVGKTVLQAELGAYGYRESHSPLHYEANGVGGDLSVRYGAFFEQLEFIVDLKYQSENFSNLGVDSRNTGFKETTIGAKFLVWDPAKNYQDKPNLYSWKANHKFSFRHFIPAIGVYAGFNFEVSHDPFRRPMYPEIGANITPRLMLLTQNQLGRFALVTNIIGDKFGTNRESIDYVITLTRGFNERWSGLLEVQGFTSSFYADGIFRIGAAYLAADNVQIDASIGANLKDTPSVANAAVGLSWRFDANYNDVFLRLPKEKKEEKKTKEEKKKAKDAKKRKDEVESTPVQP